MEIDDLNATWDDFRLLQGCELEIKADGSLDFPDEVLAGSIWLSRRCIPRCARIRQQMTQRVLGVLRNPYIDVDRPPVWAHPGPA